MSGKIIYRKIGPKGVLANEKEAAFYTCIEEMIDYRLPLTSTMVKIKVGQMIQEKLTPFKNGISSPSWMKWF